MSTAAQALASQNNGAKSRGPVSIEGRERSSRNAISHGLSSSSVLLPGESQQEYDGLVRALMNRYKPADDHATALVHEMAACSWRLRRSAALEARMLEVEIARISSDPDQDVSPDHAMGKAFINLADKSGPLSQLHRHEARLQRTYQRAVRQLTEISALNEQQAEPMKQTPVMKAPTPALGRPAVLQKQKLQNEPEVRRLMSASAQARTKENGFPTYFVG